MTTTKKPRYFYGWNIVASAFLAGLAYAEHYATVLGIFIRPIQNELGWSRSAIAAVHTISRGFEALIAPIVGPLIDRYGPRVMMPVGGFIAGLAMLGVTRINTIWQFYALRGVLSAIGFTLMGHLVTDVTINKWFVQKRGRALAISRVAGNLSSIVMTPLTVFVIAASGWRTMFVVFAAVTWLVVIVPSAILMRRRPEDMGLHPDGVDHSTDVTGGRSHDPTIEETASTLEPLWTRRELLVNRTFWLLAICFAISNIAFQGINLSLAPYMQDLGHPLTMVAGVIAFRSIIMAVSSLTMGFLAERAQKTSIRVIPFMIQTLGILLFTMGREPLFLWLGVAVYGFGTAGVHVTQEVVWANSFGRLSLGLVRSLGFSISFGLGAFGPIAINVVFDLFGSYQPAFWIIIGLLCVAALLMGLVRPAEAKHYAKADDTVFTKGSHKK